jgi:hypothetical protein
MADDTGEIFISYKSERRRAAEHLAEVLRRHGYTVWFDYQLVKGKGFARQIDTRIRAAKALVVLWCTKSVGSDWVAEEVDLAKSLGILIPTKIEDCELPVGNRLKDYIDLTGWDGAPRTHQLDPLLEAIAAKVGRDPAPNFRGLQEYEATWRRFGAPSLRVFGLEAPLEVTEGARPLSEHPGIALPSVGTAAQDAGARSRGAAGELERLLAQTDAQAARALDEMRARVAGVASQEAPQHLDETWGGLKARAARAAADLQIEQERIRAEAERLPAAARESAESMRSALGDQLRALEQLSRLSSPPDSGDRWSLGDLLAGAPREDSAINIASIARALDPTTASAIWSRFRAGQRGIMVRSIYTYEGRTLFDEIGARYRTDTDFRRTVDRFLADFERLVREIEQKDPSGRSVHKQLISDSGRVYLFLAHASGTLR